jgi:hypothetical protein
MFNFFKKKKKEEAEVEAQSEDGEPKPELKKEASEVPLDLTRVSTELDRIKANIESFGEVRKAFGERFERITEQIGELRAMILDRDRIVQEIELKAVKASDLVESVKPEKLMTEVQKQDAKLEALKANIEGNEAIMDRIMEELKEVKRKVEFIRGVEEIIKLSEEVKKELIEIKKVEATIKLNTEKSETLYSEIRKKFQDVDIFKGNLRELQLTVEQNSKDVDFLKNKTATLADKSELEALVSKVQRYIEALKELEKKSSLTKDIEQLKVMLDGIKS